MGQNRFYGRNLPTCFSKQSAQYIYLDSSLLAPVVFFAESVLKTILWAFWAEQNAQNT